MRSDLNSGGCGFVTLVIGNFLVLRSKWPAVSRVRLTRLPWDEPRPSLYVMDYRERITIEPGKRGGKPCLRGLRITVYDVLDYLAGGMTEDQILADFPELERDDIRAALGFAADRERRLISDSAA